MIDTPYVKKIQYIRFYKTSLLCESPSYTPTPTWLNEYDDWRAVVEGNGYYLTTFSMMFDYWLMRTK